MKQLERLYFLQGQRCFFCGQPIPPGEASVEHLVASSNGGAKKTRTGTYVFVADEHAAFGQSIYNALLRVGGGSRRGQTLLAREEWGSPFGRCSAFTNSTPEYSCGQRSVTLRVRDPPRHEA